MKKHYQIENYPTGDCFRACIASILESEKLEDIPNFMKDGERFFESNLKEWLDLNGYMEITYEIHGSRLLGKNFNNHLCILTGTDSVTNISHSVVGEVIYNKENNTIIYQEVHNPSKNSDTENMDFIFCTFISKRVDI